MYLTPEQKRSLKTLAGLNREVSITELSNPRRYVTLAEHGLVKVTVEITDKGQAELARQ